MTDQVPFATIAWYVSTTWLVASTIAIVAVWPSAPVSLPVMAKPAAASALLVILSLSIGLIAIVLTFVAFYLAFTKSIPFAGHGYQLKAIMADAQNIRAKSPVRISGVDVGEVSDVQHVTDANGNESGVVSIPGTDFAGIKQDVPGSSVQALDDEEYVNVPAAGAYRISATGYGTGPSRSSRANPQNSSGRLPL